MALSGLEGAVTIGGRTITSLRFADDIDGLAGEGELAKLIERLDKAATAYGIKNKNKNKKVYSCVALSLFRERHENSGRSYYTRRPWILKPLFWPF